MLKSLFQRVWGSPTANTWLSLFTRSISLVLVLPLILRNFFVAEASVWFVFSSVMAVQGILSFGFSPSFARLLAYARAGASVEDMVDLRTNRRISAQEGLNSGSVKRLTGCMVRVFACLACASLLLMTSIGSLAVWRPISLMGHASDVWIAWGVIVLGSSASFWGSYYVCFLQGMNHLAVWRRWETMTSLGSIATGFIVLLTGGRLLALVINYQVWGLFSIFLYRRLCYQLEGSIFSEAWGQWEQGVFTVVWQSAWKNGLTNILTYGLVQSTGVVYAQYAAPTETATYNFTLRLFTVIGQVVQAPFLSKLPELARLRALGDLPEQLRLIRRGMMLTHWGTVVCVAGGYMVLPSMLYWIGSRSVHFDLLLWSIFSLNLFVDRHGGMLHQIRNLTNQPMEHWGMVGYFVCNVILILSLSGLGMYAFPLGMLGTQLLFSLWFAAKISYHAIQVSPLQFERRVSIPPLLCLLALVAYRLWRA